MTDDLERFRDDALYLEKNREELMKKYPERWVAVYNKQVVGDDKDLKKLIKKLKDEGISPGHVYRARLSSKEELWVLPVIAG